MMSHLPSRFKRPKAKSRGRRLEHEVNLPSECEERDLRTCFQDPCTCTAVQNSAQCVSEPLQILDVSIIFEIFLSKLREGRSRLCIAWVRPDELEKQCEERWRRLVDVVVANSIRGRRTDEEFRLASLARRMLRLEARCRISRVVVVLGRCVTLAQNMQRAVKIHMSWGSLAQNAERAVKSRLRDRLWSAMDCERRWRELVCLSNDARFEHRLGGTWLTAHTYRRVRRAGKALPFAITVRGANVSEMTCSVYAHEKVQEVMEHALGRLAFDFQGPFTSRVTVSALMNVKHLIRNIRRPCYRSVWCCSNQGNPLQVDQTLADCGVSAGATLIIHVKAHGGMQTTPAHGEFPSREDRGSSLCDDRHEDYMQYLEDLRQEVRSAKDDSAKSQALTALLSGDRFSTLAEARRQEVTSCFVDEGRFDVRSQSFDGIPDWVTVGEKLREVKQRSNAVKSMGKFNLELLISSHVRSCDRISDIRCNKGEIICMRFLVRGYGMSVRDLSHPLAKVVSLSLPPLPHSVTLSTHSH